MDCTPSTIIGKLDGCYGNDTIDKSSHLKTTRLLLISHALTEAVRTAAFPSDESILLKENNLEAAKHLKGLGEFDQLWIGPERRTHETAVALEFAIPPVIDQDLRDCNYGRWIGRRFDDVQNKEPEAIHSWLTEPNAAPHGGESISELIKRVSAWMERISKDGKRIVAITHPSVIRAAIVYSIEAPPQSFWRINLEPLSFTDLRWHGHWTLRCLSQAA